MRWLFAVGIHPAARIGLSIAFVTPAVVMSYFLLESLSTGHVPSEAWRQAICALGACTVGLAAFGRLAAPEPGCVEHPRSGPSRFTSAKRAAKVRRAT